MSKYLKAFYSKEEKPYTIYPLELTDYLVDKFDLTKGNVKLLDLGSGRGEFMESFKVSLTKISDGIIVNPNVKGFDKEKCMSVDMFNNIYSDITLGDFDDKLPYKNDSFDIVFAKSVIEHTYYPEHMVSEVYRILKPKGKFIVMTPDWEYHYKFFYEDFTHKTPFIRSSLERILKMCDFQVKYCKRFRQLPFLWKYPKLNFIASVAQLFYHSETENTLIKFSKEVMLLAMGVK